MLGILFGWSVFPRQNNSLLNGFMFRECTQLTTHVTKFISLEFGPHTLFNSPWIYTRESFLILLLHHCWLLLYIRLYIYIILNFVQIIVFADWFADYPSHRQVSFFFHSLICIDMTIPYDMLQTYMLNTQDLLLILKVLSKISRSQGCHRKPQDFSIFFSPFHHLEGRLLIVHDT